MAYEDKTIDTTDGTVSYNVYICDVCAAYSVFERYDYLFPKGRLPEIYRSAACSIVCFKQMMRGLFTIFPDDHQFKTKPPW